MPPNPRASWALHKLPTLLLCVALALGAPQPASAAKATPQPTKLPQPTRDPGAEPYDDTRPELLAPDMLIASSAILIEAQSGDVVFEKNADEIMYPASTTKIMTALLTVQSIEYNDLPAEVLISATAANQPGDASLIPVSEGEVVDIKDLLFGMMLRSGNDAATALAEHIAGSETAFATIMNESAAFLGCANTHFVNAHGYHDPDHYTTARDMAVIARLAMSLPLFRETVSAVEYLMPATEKHPARRLVTNDTFINGDNPDNNYYYPDAIGVKTGFHSDAMYCFVGAAERNGVELISVVFYTSDRGRWVDTERLMEYGFSQFVSTTPEAIYNNSPRVVNISGFDLSDAKNLGRLELGIRPMDENRKVTIVGRKEDLAAIERDFGKLAQVRITGPDRAPITEGEIMGYLTYTPSDGIPAEYELYATRTIAARTDAPLTLDEIEALTLADPNPLPPFSLEFLVVPSSLLLAVFALVKLFRNHRGRRHSRKQKKRLPLPKIRHFR